MMAFLGVVHSSLPHVRRHWNFEQFEAAKNVINIEQKIKNYQKQNIQNSNSNFPKYSHANVFTSEKNLALKAANTPFTKLQISYFDFEKEMKFVGVPLFFSI